VIATSPIWAEDLIARLSPFAEGQDIERPTLRDFMIFSINCARTVLRQVALARKGPALGGAHALQTLLLYLRNTSTVIPLQVGKTPRGRWLAWHQEN